MSEEKDTRLSYSSATLLSNCSQKYHYKKVAEVAKDTDVDEDYTAFNIGKAFHHVLEHTNHVYPGNEELQKMVVESCEMYFVPDDVAKIHAMLLKYWKLHNASGLKAVVCEIELANKIFLGYVDVIMKDEEGNWYIVDLKTAARFSELTASRLHNDTQLNLYSYFVKEIAKQYKLDASKFKGTLYRVTTKSKLKQKKSESYDEFVMRVYENIESYSIHVDNSILKPEVAYKKHEELHKLSMKLRANKAKPMKNYSYCDSFFRPCEYWSQCHGATYTECSSAINVTSTNDL